MTRAEAARRYLQASMAANTTALPGDAKEAHEGTMARLEREHPGAAELAVVGANTDFDRGLTPGEREHQAHLRAGASQNELRARREKVRGGHAPARARRAAPASRRSAVRAGVAGGRGYARARRTIAGSSGVADTGSLALQAIGVAIGLSLLYLTLSPGGSKAFSTLLDGVTKGLRLFVGPFDPLSPHSSSSASSTPEAIGPAGVSAERIQPGGAVAASPVQSRKLNPKFGPGPGIGGPITPVGVTR